MAGYLLGINNLPKIPWVWEPSSEQQKCSLGKLEMGWQNRASALGPLGSLGPVRPSGGSGMQRAGEQGEGQGDSPGLQ